MKHNKRNLIFYAVTVLFCIPLCMTGIPAAQAQEGLDPLIIMSPGGSEVFPFYIDGIFDIQELSPFAFTSIITFGQDPSAPGTITLTLTPKTVTSSDFLFKIDYMMIGFSYALNGTPALISASKSTPLNIVQKIPINSSFGMAVVGILVTGVNNEGDFIFPAKFALTVEVSKAEPKPAADEE